MHLSMYSGMVFIPLRLQTRFCRMTYWLLASLSYPNPVSYLLWIYIFLRIVRLLLYWFGLCKSRLNMFDDNVYSVF